MESKFKVGDRVMSLVNGIGEVIRIYDNTPDLKVKYPHFSDELRYSQDGKFDNHDLYPEIYKDGDIHPILNVPIRIPKQKVKKQFELFLHKERVQNSFVLEWDNGRFWVSDLMYDKPCISAKIIFEVEE